jgi:hypothetical protein
MWETRTFKTLEAQKNWINANDHRYQIEIIFVNNGYGVEYRRLVRPGLPR